MTSSNPLLYKTGLPPFHLIQPIHVEPAVDLVLDAANQRFETLVANIRTNDHFIDQLDDIDQSIHRVWSPVSHLMGVMNSPELRAVYEKMQPKLIEFGLKVSQSREIFDKLVDLQKSPTFKNLSRARQRVIEQRILSATLAGVGLDGPTKDRFNAISQEMAQLRTQFQNNVLDATKAWSVTLTKKEEVDGVPTHALEMSSQDFLQHNKDAKSTPSDGPWRFTLDMPSYIPFMEHAKNRDLREKMYRARIALASTAPHDNSPLIDKILSLRSEAAKLLGFSTYAEQSVKAKMAGTVDAVDQLLNELLDASYAAGMKEHQELESYAQSKGVQHSLLEWDIPYWSERYKEEKYQFSEDELRPYFPIDQVLSGLFSLVKEIFSINVKAADGEAPIWHNDVRFFKIFDLNSNEHLASFYLDPFSRPGIKRGGAWMDDCVSRRKANGELNIPVAYLICNGTPPAPVKKGLMTFDQVRTLFHEFGHGLQHMLTTVDELGVSGISGVEWDAVELASQFMENWLYHVPTLKSLSGHVETGEKIPDHYIQKIIATRHYRAATFMLRQLHFGMTDIELHHRYQVGVSKETPHEISLRIGKKTSALPPRPENRSLCSFSHIFAGGYSAGYYSYKWAEVLSADAFAAFEEAGLDDLTAMRNTGLRYRNSILALGGSEHPMAVFKSFRGREPSTAALLRHSGL